MISKLLGSNNYFANQLHCLFYISYQTMKNKMTKKAQMMKGWLILAMDMLWGRRD